MKLGTIKFNPKDITKNRGHEYGKGRATQTHKSQTKPRKKDWSHDEH